MDGAVVDDGGGFLGSRLAIIGKPVMKPGGEDLEAAAVAEVEGGQPVGGQEVICGVDGKENVVNLDYVVRMREYPVGKNGKRKSIVMD